MNIILDANCLILKLKVKIGIKILQKPKLLLEIPHTK